jgi:integrase
LRPLRSIINGAIEEGHLKKDKAYPFGRRKYQIPTSRNMKKALELSEVEMIYYYPSSKLTETEERCRDFWLFSYFGNGMNPKDIATLKYHNIQDDFIIFERSKTEQSLRSDPKPIVVFLNEDMKCIITKWGNEKNSPNDYIFNILPNGITPLRQYALIQNFVRLVNDTMKKILKELGINKKATTYVARHTFSTVLKRSGASTEVIQEALGHTDIRTTENYLDSFDNETKRQLAARLASFKNKE